MADISETLGEQLADFVDRRARATEECCEAALAAGQHGVSTWTWQQLDEHGMAVGMCFEVRVDPDVPYGAIHAHDSAPPD